MFKFIGKSIEVKYNTGFHFRIDYLSDKKLRWTTLVDRPDGGESAGTETYYLNELTDDIFMVNWIEETGLTVSQSLDFNKLKVYALLSWDDESAENTRGGRAHLIQYGDIKILD